MEEICYFETSDSIEITRRYDTEVLINKYYFNENEYS
jgi:hypothetical protein